MELSKEHDRTVGKHDLSDLQEKILDTLEDQLAVTKRRAKGQEDYEREWRVEAAQISELAKSMNTTGNVLEQMRDSFKLKKESAAEKFGIKNGGLGRTIMGSLNVGGIFNKAIAKSEFKQKQRLLGGDTSDEAAEGAYNASKAIKKNEAAIAKFQQQTGIKEEDMHQYEGGRKLLDKRREHADEYAKYDVAAHAFDPSKTKYELNPSTQFAKTSEEKEEGAAEQKKFETDTIGEQAKIVETQKEMGTTLKDSLEVHKQMLEAIKAGGSGGSSVLGDVADVASNFMGKGGKFLSKAGKFAKSAGGNVLKFAKGAALPAAAAVAGGYAVDAGLGALGVGKDKEGNDIQIDEKQDDANWEKMSLGEKAQSGLARGIEKAGSFFFLDNLANEAKQKRIKSESDYLESQGRMTPSSISNAGAIIEGKSNEVQEARDNKASASNNIVNAPSTNITNSSTQSNVIRSPIKNEESSLNKYIGSRYAAR
jgi:hypothetical protein